MRLTLFLACLLALCFLSGCGGSSSGVDSDVTVRLFRTDNTQDLRQFELFLTPNAETSFDPNDPETYVSTLNQPSWIDAYDSFRSSQELSISFRTRGDQTPYFVFVGVPNTGAQFETVKLRVDIDGSQGHESTFDLDIDSISRLTGVRIDSNSAEYRPGAKPEKIARPSKKR